MLGKCLYYDMGSKYLRFMHNLFIWMKKQVRVCSVVRNLIFRV